MGYLRLTLASIIVLGHVPGGNALLTTIGAGAVEAFFVISGFYMAATYERHYRGPQRAVRFWVSRFTRLYPLYITMMIVMAALWVAVPRLGWPINSTNSFYYFAAPQPWYVETAAWSLIGQDLLSVEPRYHYAFPVRQSWSISAELVFYALTPLLLRLRGYGLVAITTAAFAAKAVAFVYLGFRWVYFPFVFQLGYFTLGLAIYRFRERLTPVWNPARTITLVLIVLFLALPNATAGFGALWAHAVAIGALALAMPAIFARREGRASLMAGDLSYGVYLMHLTVIDLIIAAFHLPKMPAGMLTIAVLTGAVFAVTIALAWAFERVVQEPIDRWRRRTFYDRRGSQGIRAVRVEAA